MKTVADTLWVARSHLIDLLRDTPKPRRRTHKAQDAALAPEIQRLVDERPTYGYRRITALLNRERAAKRWINAACSTIRGSFSASVRR